eukprot:Opistho-2@64785
MWMYAIMFVVLVYVALLLWPTPMNKAASLDNYIADPSSNAADAEQDDDDDEQELAKYKRVFTTPGKQLVIVYGTEYGFSETIARRLYDAIEPLESEGFQPRLVNLKNSAIVDFKKEQVILAVCSTTGDGVPPTDARDFFSAVTSGKIGNLSHASFSVLALGDKGYPHYCRAGRLLDEKLEALGARRFARRIDVDMEDFPAIDNWIAAVVAGIPSLGLDERIDYMDVGACADDSGFSRTNPYWARIAVKRDLCGAGEERQVVHVEFDLGDSGIEYTPGDSLGICPENNPAEVEVLLKAMRCTGTETVTAPPGCYDPKIGRKEKMPLQNALRRFYDIKTVKPELIRNLIPMSRDRRESEKGRAILMEGQSVASNSVLRAYLYGREVADVLTDFSSAKPDISDVLTHLRLLQPRYYSISSAQSVVGKRVSVTAAVVRYDSLGKARTGVCTTFLQDRRNISEECPVFIGKNPEFRLPTNGSLPIIMVGPGTGLAPFRAFLQERKITKARGDNLLYFGCRDRNKDYLYRGELEALEKEKGVILRTAFSREAGQKKVYVQHLLKQDADLVWSLLQRGAHFYVCGDAKNMAGDVHETLLDIISAKKGTSRENAEAFMADLENNKRYQRDVWIT